MIRSFSLWRSCLVLALLSALSPLQAASADDIVGEMREAAKIWGWQGIALIEAQNGKVRSALRIIDRIGNNAERCSPTVTVVSFCNGQPIYRVVADAPARDCPDFRGRHGNAVVGENGTGPFTASATQYESVVDGNKNGTSSPSRPSPELPAEYFAPHPRHGELVDFAEQYDSHGTRVTSRKYADGHFIIETPHARPRVQ
jgi:hypothetical protein